MPRELTEQHKAAMQAGRIAAGETRRREAIKRVKDFREWNRDDAENGRPGARKPMPAVPSDSDYDVARKAGAIT